MSVQGHESGPLGFLTKPFRKQPLCDAVQEALLRDGEARQQRFETADLRKPSSW